MFCGCNDSTIPWKEFSRRALWLEHIYDNIPAHFDNWLLKHMVGASPLMLVGDYMHCKHLGVDQYFLGSVIILMVLMDGNGPALVAAHA